MAAMTPGTSAVLDRGPNLPSRMVAVPKSATDSALNVTRLSTGYKPAFEGVVYNPRAQRSAGREQWREDVAESVRKSGIPSSTLTKPPPTAKSVMDENPKLDVEEVDAALDDALAEYQLRNTALYDVARPSVDLSGPFEMDDREFIRKTYMNGDLRDGYGFYTWVDSFGETTDIGSQASLLKQLSNWPELSAGASRAELTTHCSSLLRLWSQIGSNSESAPIDYYTRLLNSLPTTPPTSLICVLRNFYADLITRQDQVLGNPRKVIQLLDKHAETLGIKPGIKPSNGAQGGPSVMVATNDTTESTIAALAQLGLGSNAAGNAQLVAVLSRLGVKFNGKPNGNNNPNRNGRKQPASPSDAPNEQRTASRPNYGKNDCDYCPIDACECNKWSLASRKPKADE